MGIIKVERVNVLPFFMCKVIQIGKRKFQMEYGVIDEIIRDTQGLLLKGVDPLKSVNQELSAPILFGLSNPLARFSCLPERKSKIAETAAESLYLFSGMNGSDFIWEFRGWEDPRIKTKKDENALGPELRFQGQKTEDILDYHKSNVLRQRSTGYTDQLAQAVEKLKNDRTARDAVIQFASVKNSLAVHSVWFFCNENNRLDMLVSAGRIDDLFMWYKIISPFAFLHQVVSDLTEIPMGISRFMVGCLCTSALTHPKHLRSQQFPVINIHDFQYPNGKLSLQDMDTLMSIMVEFVSRLDENSLSRANPFEGDTRVQMWSDYAEIFRAWKAEKLGYKIQMEQNFHHPQLRFVYKGEAV